MIGTIVGSYRITQKVAVGGMGTVYKAEHTLIGKLAAVKVLHPELRNNNEVVNRFFNEAKATTQIKHPGIVEIFDFGYLPTGDGYIVMEFLDGESLARRLTTRGTMGDGEAAMLLRGVCSALAAAHAKKIIHRDLKPDNVFLCPDPDTAIGERPKLLDFGIAKLTDAALGGSHSATKTGAVMGTPTYMSPEQCRGTGEVDARSDLYSIGCMFYEMVAGVPPFVAQGAGELIGAHLFVEPEAPSKHVAGILPETDKLILELLDKKPDKRPQTAKELGQRLTMIAQHSGWITRMSPSGVTAVDKRPDEMLAAAGLLTPPPRDSAEALMPTRTSEVEVLPQPTTLSLAASQSVPDLGRRRSRTKLFAALGAAVLVVGAGVGFVAMKSTSDDSAPVAAQPPPPPPVEATHPAVPPPAPPVEKVATPAPPVEKVVTPPPPVEKVATTPPPVVKTVKTTPHPPPIVKKKPPTGTGSGSGSGSGSGKILIETDI